MDLYLVRHAKAEPRCPGRPDADRPLTLDGAERFARCVQGLSVIVGQLDRVVHSPWARAAQTAALLEPLRGGPLVETHALAAPPGPALLGFVSGERVALVGHEPWMSQTLSWLVAGDPGRLDVDFKKGGVAWLRGALHPGQMTLRAFLPPKVLCAMG